LLFVLWIIGFNIDMKLDLVVIICRLLLWSMVLGYAHIACRSRLLLMR